MEIVEGKIHTRSRMKNKCWDKLAVDVIAHKSRRRKNEQRNLINLKMKIAIQTQKRKERENKA